MTIAEIKMHEKLKTKPTYWGRSCCIDLYECDLRLMQDAEAIKDFVYKLCDRIGMRRYGETQIVRFGDDPRVTGFTMTQMIETSLISAHFADNSCAIYLDVFSCAPFDPKKVVDFAAKFFKARRCNYKSILRR